MSYLMRLDEPSWVARLASPFLWNEIRLSFRNRLLWTLSPPETSTTWAAAGSNRKFHHFSCLLLLRAKTSESGGCGDQAVSGATCSVSSKASSPPDKRYPRQHFLFGVPVIVFYLLFNICMCFQIRHFLWRALGAFLQTCTFLIQRIDLRFNNGFINLLTSYAPALICWYSLCWSSSQKGG